MLLKRVQGESEEMKRTKSLILILLLMLIIVSITSTRISTASPEVVVYVDPSEVLDMEVGNSFDIYVTASDVVDLFLAEIRLSWDPPLLNTDVDSINFGDVAPFLDFIYVEEVNNEEGWLTVTAGRPVGVWTGLSGKVQIAKITFQVMAEGSSALYLYDTRLKNVVGADLDHTTKDGYFANVQYIYSSDVNGIQKNAFQHGDPVYVKGGLFPETPVTVDIYVVANTKWVDGQVIGTYENKISTTIEGSGNLPVTSLGPAGLNDIVVDYNRNGIYDKATDAVDDVTRKSGVIVPWHDIRVYSMDPNATQVFLGESLPVNVTILNEGTFEENFNVSLYYDTTSIYNTSDTLLPGFNKTLTLNWNTIGVIPGTYTIRVNVTLAQDEDPDDNWKEETIEIKPAWGSIKGKVISKYTELPIFNATVTAREQYGLENRSTTTAADGTYMLADMLVGKYSIIASKAGYENTSLVDEVEKDDIISVRDLKLWPSQPQEMGWIEGTVTDAETVLPLEGATVTAGIYAALTNASGYYRVEIVSGTYNVTAEMAPYYNSTTEYDFVIPKNITKSLNFALERKPTGWIDGYVTDSETGEAIVDATVTAVSADAYPYSNTTGANGYYKLKVVASIDAGTYNVTAEMALNYESKTEYLIVVSKDSTTTLNFTLDPLAKGWIDGYVTDSETGEAIVDATVTAVSADAFSYSNTTDGTGYYEIELPSNRTYDVTASAPDYFSEEKTGIAVEPGTTTVNFTLTHKKHDVSVVSVTPVPEEVTPGDSVRIDVTVKNEGDYVETSFNITAYYDGTTIETRTVTSPLLVNGTGSATFNWNTTGVSPGTYNITAKVDLTPITDDDPADNELTVTVKVLGHDIAVTGITTSPTEVVVGDSVSINVTVKNEGDFSETFSVTVRYDENLIGTQTDVSLNAGAIITLNFTWDTAGVSPDDYRIIAEATLDVDDDQADNTMEGDTVMVKGAATDIFLYAVVAIVIAIMMAGILVYIFRVKKQKST